MKKILIFVLVLILLVGLWWFLVQDEYEEPDPENGDEVVEIDEDNPYHQAEEITPIGSRNEVMDEDFRLVLNEIFEEEPKLVKSGEITALSYIVDRPITPEDVTDIKELLEVEGYETAATSSEDDEYELDISLTEELLEDKYDGDLGGNMYVVFWTTEEGEDAQKIEVKLL